MKRLLRILISSMAGLALLTDLAIAQTTARNKAIVDDECFMVTSSGRTLSLNSLCNGSTPNAPAATQPSSSSNRQMFQARIKRREFSTPVIDVKFNGKQTFEMILDTGASGTLITRQMAAALKVVPVGRVVSSTANGIAEFPIGNIASIEVNGAVARNVKVAIAGPGQDVGLLGHDFFGNYDVTIRRDVVEFRRRN